MIVKLTENFISTGLQCSVGKRREEMVDSVVPGMFIEVRAVSQGQGTYYFRYKDANGHTQTKKLGRSIDITLSAAREYAREIRAQVALGKNPRATEKADKAVMTLNDYWADVYYPVSKSMKRSHLREEQLFRLRIQPKFGNLRLNQITRQQLQTFHLSLREEGLSFASSDLHLKLFKVMFSRAIDAGLIDKSPAAKLPLFNFDNKVERYLDEEELKRLLQVLQTDSCQMVAKICLLLLSTGARLNEILSSKWSQLDSKSSTLRIAAETSKSRKIRHIQLNSTSMDIIDNLTTEGKYEYLFINHKTGNRFCNIHKVWDKFRKKADLQNFRLHDLRHTHASMLANAGVSIYIIQNVLSHSDPATTQKYAHLSKKTLQDASNEVSLIINTAMQFNTNTSAILV